MRVLEAALAPVAYRVKALAGEPLQKIKLKDSSHRPLERAAVYHVNQMCSLTAMLPSSSPNYAAFTAHCGMHWCRWGRHRRYGRGRFKQPSGQIRAQEAPCCRHAAHTSRASGSQAAGRPSAVMLGAISLAARLPDHIAIGARL